MATQLRRYQIAEGRMDDFLAFFPTMSPVRASHGFSVDFAYADRENNEFVWSTTHDGDVDAFKAAEAIYNDSPARAQALKGGVGLVEAMHVSMVEQV